MQPAFHSLVRHALEGDVEALHQISEVRAVADDGPDAGAKLARVVSQQQIAEAVHFARGEHDDVLGAGGV